MKKTDENQNNDHSDDESLKKAAQRCREIRKRLMRRKAVQSEFSGEKAQKLTEIGEDERRERNGRIHIRRIVEFERQKLDMEKKRRREQIGVRDRDEEEEEEAPRKSENSSRFQELEPEMAPPEMKNRVKKRARSTDG